MSVEGAHVKNTEAASVVFSVDGRTVLTRGGDDTVKRMCNDLLNDSALIEMQYFSMGYPFLQTSCGDTFGDDDTLPWDKCRVQS